MKKFLLSISLLVCVTTIHAQFKVNPDGKVDNLTVRGSFSSTQGILHITGLIPPNYHPDNTVGAYISTIAIAGSYIQVNKNEWGGVNYGIDSYGRIFATSLTQLSDSLLKENISELQSTLSKVKRLRGITFDYKEESPMGRKRSSQAENLALGATPEISRQMTKELSRQRIGLLAQEVEQVFPEAVRTLYDGSKGVMYGDLVGVLVEAINELQDSLTTQAQELATLKQEVATIKSILFPDEAEKNRKQGINGSGNTGIGNTGAVLYQNTPNPFNRETEIAYHLPEGFPSAAICIYNLNGQQLKRYPLDKKSQTGSITISASAFEPGMYIYALLINNQVVDSKKMTLTD